MYLIQTLKFVNNLIINHKYLLELKRKMEGCVRIINLCNKCDQKALQDTTYA